MSKQNNEVTPVRQQILDYIGEYMNAKRYPPTVREIKTACGFSTTSLVDYHLDKLSRAGMIEREKRVARGIRLVGEGQS